MANSMEKIYNDYIGGINKETFHLLFDDYDIKKRNNYEKRWIEEKINFFTYGSITKLVSLNEYFKYQLYLLRIIKDNNNYIVKLNDKEYEFYLLSDIFEDKKIVKHLKSRKRKGTCHIKSIAVSLKYFSKCNIITGMYNTINKAYFHSVIEINFGNNPMIIDYTRNIFMKKKDYYELFDFDEINKISVDEYLDNFEIIDSFFDINLIATLLFYREILKCLKVGNEIFKEKCELKSEILEYRNKVFKNEKTD